MEDIDKQEARDNDSEENLLAGEVIQGDVDLFYLDVLLTEVFRRETSDLG